MKRKEKRLLTIVLCYSLIALISAISHRIKCEIRRLSIELSTEIGHTKSCETLTHYGNGGKNTVGSGSGADSGPRFRSRGQDGCPYTPSRDEAWVVRSWECGRAGRTGWPRRGWPGGCARCGRTGSFGSADAGFGSNVRTPKESSGMTRRDMRGEHRLHAN